MERIVKQEALLSSTRPRSPVYPMSDIIIRAANLAKLYHIGRGQDSDRTGEEQGNDAVSLDARD